MTPKPSKAAFIFATVLVIAAFVAINTWAAVPKPHSDLAAPGKAGVYRSDLWMVYLGLLSRFASAATWFRDRAKPDIAARRSISCPRRLR